MYEGAPLQHERKPQLAQYSRGDDGPMKCPHCGLINPDIAERCDCGYDFTAKTVEQAYAHAEPEKKAPKSPRGLRVLVFAGWCIASIIFLVGVFAPRMNSDAVERFTESVTEMCLKGSLGLWVLTELLGAQKLTVKAVLILTTVIYVVGIGGFSLYLLFGR